jgi:hypothetical protein
MKLDTAQKGLLEIVRISEKKDGTWEDEWEPLRTTPLGNLVSRVSQANLNHALHGLSKPFVDALGISPEGALRKMPSQRCALEKRCTFYHERKCVTTSDKLPWCYVPAGMELSEAAQSMAAQAVFHWKNKIYLVVIPDEN